MGSTGGTDEEEKWEKWLLLLGFQWWHNCLQPHQFAFPVWAGKTAAQVGTPHSTCTPVPGWLSQPGVSPQGHGKCSPVANGVSLSPPNSSASADAEGVTRRTLKSLTSATSQNRGERMEKMGWCLKGFLGSCQFGWTPKASTGSHAGISHDSKAARAQAGKAKFGNGDHLYHSPWQQPSISLQLLCRLQPVLGKCFHSYSVLQINPCLTSFSEK